MTTKGKALFAYTSRNSKELDLKLDEVITILGPHDNIWYSAEKNGKKGYIPIHYIKLLPDEKKETKNEPSNNNVNKVKAIYTYHAKTNEQISFQAGEIIEVIEKIDKNWCKGRIGNREGKFPNSFVEPINSPPSGNSSSDSQDLEDEKEVQPPCNGIALFPYTKKTESELSFDKGDELSIIEKLDRGWARAKFLGNEGLVPFSFFKLVPKPAPSPSRPASLSTRKEKLVYTNEAPPAPSQANNITKIEKLSPSKKEKEEKEQIKDKENQKERRRPSNRAEVYSKSHHGHHSKKEKRKHSPTEKDSSEKKNAATRSKSHTEPPLKSHSKSSTMKTAKRSSDTDDFGHQIRKLQTLKERDRHNHSSRRRSLSPSGNDDKIIQEALPNLSPMFQTTQVQFLNEQIDFLLKQNHKLTKKLERLETELATETEVRKDLQDRIKIIESKVGISAQKEIRKQ